MITLLKKMVPGGRFFKYVSIYILTVLIMGSGCKTTTFSSNWKENDISIDGDHTDWQIAMEYFKEKNVTIGFQNDEKFVYICLMLHDNLMQRQVIQQGFTVWLDVKGGKNKNFGIRYPIGMSGREFSLQRPGFGQEQMIGDMNGEQYRKDIMQSLSELEILGPGESDVSRFGVDELSGLEVEVGNKTGVFVYELKVPLVKDEEYPFAIGLKGESSIGIGFETNDSDRNKMVGRMGRGTNRGGSVVHGGGRTGMRGGNMRRMGGGGGMRRIIMEPLKMWIKILMAHPVNAVSF